MQVSKSGAGDLWVSVGGFGTWSVWYLLTECLSPCSARPLGRTATALRFLERAKPPQIVSLSEWVWRLSEEVASPEVAVSELTCYHYV